MSSIDQAFVKAFARRSRPTRDVSAAEAATDHDSGELNSDAAASQTAQVWIDASGDRILRADVGTDISVPDPHHMSTATPIRPSEHFRCDYVFGAVKEVLPNEPTSDVETVKVDSSGSPAEPKIADDGDSVSEDVIERPEVEKSVAEVSTPEVEMVETAGKSGTETTVPGAIEAAWEVDLFEVPSTAADLFFDEDFFQGIANHMRNAVDDGLKSLVVTSAQSGEGRSTVAIGIAIAAAATGLQVALVDGDTEAPSLADDLRLDLEDGWVDTVRGGLPIDQIAVHSIQDGVVLFPLIPSKTNTQGATADEVEQLMQALADQFDLIVVDGPTCAMPRIQQFAALVDTAIITRDSARTNTDTVNELSNRLKASGVKGVGIVENFK